MQHFRRLPDGIIRLPTMCITIDVHGSAEDDFMFFDEITGTSVSTSLTILLFHLALFNSCPSVMLINILNRHTHFNHCNSLIIYNYTIERFDPRGNLTGANHYAAHNYYDIKSMNTFMRKLFRAWCNNLGVLRKSHIINGSPMNIQTPLLYVRYYSPLPHGIGSLDTLYKHSPFCARLVFCYLNIRTSPSYQHLNRRSAHIQWLHTELSRQVINTH